MHVLFKLTDNDIGMEMREVNKYKVRIASRGIVLGNDGKIALQYKKNTNEYKLIGGGIEENEEPNIAFEREVLEETGCKIEIIKELGVTEEYISTKCAKQISHIFVANVIKDMKVLQLTEKEKTEGAKLIWVTLQEGLRLIKDSFDKLVSSNYSKDYDIFRMKFIALRDSKILEYYINNFKE